MNIRAKSNSVKFVLPLNFQTRMNECGMIWQENPQFPVNYQYVKKRQNLELYKIFSIW